MCEIKKNRKFFFYFAHTNNYNTLHLQFITGNCYRLQKKKDKVHKTGTPTNGLMCCLLLLRPRSERPSAAELLTDPFVVDQQQ